MDIKKIGVGVDMSTESINALEQAMVVARKTGASIVTITAGDVYESGAVEGPTAAAIEHYQTVLAERQERIRAELAELHQRYEGQGVELSQVLVHGFADIAIPDAAEDLDLDLLVMGTHGRTGLTRFFLGSVAERVVRLARCDVLTARGETRRIRKVLVPTDFSPHADRAIEAAVELAEAGGEITLLHCTGIHGDADETLPRHLAESVETAIQAHAEKQAALFHEAELSVDTAVRTGAPAAEIRAMAENGYDLVCMGSHGRRGVRRMLLGSVAEVTVRHAPCSVYVAHIRDDAE